MSTECVLQGIGVSHGIVVAPIFRLPDLAAMDRPSGSPQQERRALDAAIAAAASALQTLMETSDKDAAEMLEFQVVLLEDDDLTGPVHAAIESGIPAHDAWREVLDREILAYGGGAPDDDTFSARASDLADLRDRVLRHLVGDDLDALPDEPSIIFARDLPPSRFLEMDAKVVAGIALGQGSRTSHVSLLARAKGLPLVVGLGAVTEETLAGEAVLDADAGSLTLRPTLATREAAAARSIEEAARTSKIAGLLARPAATADGEPVKVLINVDHPSLLADIDPGHCDGIGLTRTEFLFQDGAASEDVQFDTYRALVEWAGGRPVTIRTLDAGGDKPLPGVTRDGERNPFLGVRGIRLSLRHTDLFKVQLRAMLRAAAVGPVKVMVPMVTVPEELVAVRRLIEEAEAELAGTGAVFERPALGMMVEVPAAALAARDFDADFYSIGSNDLIQYATACARDNGEVADLARPDHPGVICLIEAVAAAARARAVEVSVCGDMASDPNDAVLLLKAGIRVLSVAPAEIGAIKAAIADYWAGTG
jgi:phosphotransferase system enzyme I (PtsI)